VLTAATLLTTACSDDDASTSSTTLEATTLAAATTDTANSDSEPATGAPEVEIVIEKFDFGAPQTVLLGGEVTVRNSDPVPHTWTASGDPGFDSGPIAQDSEFRYRFEQVGTFEFFCGIHPSMKGSITVVEG
jgi:plastocyanin